MMITKWMEVKPQIHAILEHTVVVSNTWDVTGQNVVAAHTGTVKRPPTPQWPRPLARVM